MGASRGGPVHPNCGILDRRMSKDNIDLVRRGAEAIARDWPASEESASEEFRRVLAEGFHPDAEWHDQRELPGSTVHVGLDAIARHMEQSRRTLLYDPPELLEPIDAGSRVVAVYRMRARGLASGVPVERDAVFVYTFRGAKVERVEIFAGKGEAFEAAGLAE
jgi:ketosteroid isomerase-like protein